MDFKQLLASMVKQRATDLFITSRLPPSMKIGGVISPVGSTPLSAEQARNLVLAVMNARQRSVFEETHECQFALAVEEIGRFRISAFVQRDHPGMVLRRIESRIPTVEELNLPQVIVDLGMARRGLLLFVGGNGAGKSTTLAALIGHRNRHGNGHILTIEDPIEFLHEHQGCVITQRDVGVDTDSIEGALHLASRQSPDVVMVGQIRNRQVLEEALGLVEAGHLVLSSLHVENADQALERLVNLFPDESRRLVLTKLAFNLSGVVGQRLVPVEDQSGMIPAFEVLINTPLIADIIRRDDLASLRGSMANNAEQGMCTFDQSLFALFRNGKISFHQALDHADSRNAVRLMIKTSEERIGATESRPAPARG